jgi:hypothetical protein
VVMSVVAISSGYLRGRPRPLFGGWVTSGVCTAVGCCCGLSGYICMSGSGLLLVKYGFTTVDRKVVGPLGNLIVHVSPLIVSKSNGLS